MLGLFNGLIIDVIMDGDVCSRLGSIEYSTNPREVVTVGDMFDHHEQTILIEKEIIGRLGA